MFSPLAFCHRKFTLSVLNRLLEPEQTRPRSGYAPIRGRLLYVAQSARPYDINGYTARTHELLRALQEDGDVHACTRCGYPWDRHRKASPAREDGFFSTLVDTVRYLHLPAPRNNCLTAIYAGQAARFLEDLCRKIRPAVIHAASNHVNALPTLIVAKRLGIPFQYEIRGLWELSRLANNPDYKRSHNLALGLELEGYVARHADRVFVISEELAQYAKEHWRIEEKRLVLLPNCVNPERFTGEERTEQGHRHPILGYAGSLVAYEGLDVLLHALKLMGSPPHLEIVGDGAARTSLEALASSLGLLDTVVFFGRVSPKEAIKRLKSWDMVCLPRRADMVCQLIPPLKLVEAMAMGKAILVPDLPLFRAETGNLGNFFKPQNPQSLAQVLANLLQGRDWARQGSKNRQYVLERRLWRHFVPQILALANNRKESPC